MIAISNISVKWKIYLIAIVSLISFGGYLAFNVVVNGDNAKLLKQLQETTYPALEIATTNRVRLDRLSELLNSAVTIGEKDYIVTAKESADLIVNDFKTIATILPKQSEQVAKLQTQFISYFTQAEKIASDMLEHSADVNLADDSNAMASIQQSVERKEQALTDYKNGLDAFIKDAKNNFSSNIETADRNSSNLLTFGFGIWIISIIILTLTVFTIAKIILTNINDVSSSLTEIAQGTEDFTKKITVTSNDEIGMLATSFNNLLDNLRIKTNDLMSMMQNMHQGLFTITESETIHREYSSYIETLFRTKEVSGAYFGDLLFKNTTLGSDQVDQVKTTVSSLLGMDEMMFDFNRASLIDEYEIEFEQNGEKECHILEVDWDPIVTDDVITKIMVTVRDVTELRKMQAAAESQKRELSIVGQILKASIGKLDDFIKNATDLLSRNETMIANTSEKSDEVISNLFVNMHTIKGNARTYEFSYIRDVVHEAENTYDRLRKDPDTEWNSSQLLHELDLVKSAIAEYRAIREAKLNFASAASISDDQLIIQKEFFENLVSTISADLSTTNVSTQRTHAYLHKLNIMRSVPLPEVLAEITSSLASVAEQLTLPAPFVSFTGTPLHIFSDKASVIQNVFTHLLRNSLSHGIEDVATRTEKGKPEAGTITMNTFISDAPIIEVFDDGRGLNIARLREKATETGYLTEDEVDNYEKIANYIFESGVSTAQSLTEISGRGVGMDAVKKYLLQCGCNISIEIEPNLPKGLDFAPFKLRLKLSEQVALPSEIID